MTSAHRLTLRDLPAYRTGCEQGYRLQPGQVVILVGLATCGLAAGGADVAAAIREELASRQPEVCAAGRQVEVRSTGCLGLCEQEVLVDVHFAGQPRLTYAHVTPDLARRIVAEHVVGGRPIENRIIGRIEDEDHPYKDQTACAKQVRIVLANCGFIDPERIEHYVARGGYAGLERVLQGLSPAGVIAEVKVSGLRGRGGAGFPTGLKWEFAARAAGDKKYVVCNADEGDPGAFMDRSVLEGDPHAVIEGMLIGAYAIGADEGYIYCRAEYPLAIKRLRVAIEQAEALGLLGRNILGTGFGFELHIKEGAGAFVCGEETALMASIMGLRGTPRPRPPFPANRGLWDKPTNINNVETWANVPRILVRGGAWFAGIGTERSKGTKVFALTGKIRNTGLAEVPMGITLREIVYEIGGGIQNDRQYKAVQIGGPSGGCMPASLLDTPVDYDSLVAAGAMMGSGGMVVVDEGTCMVDLARFFMAFVQSESCGKCPPCRVGTRLMLETLERICAGEGQPGDIDWLVDMGRKIKAFSLCGLGQTAPNPVLTTIQYFRDEYEAHIRDKTCPAGVCPALVSFGVIADKCKGCGRCIKVCPSGAASGKLKEVHSIDAALCIRCGACFEACKFEAIERGQPAAAPAEVAG
ncbi:MAG: NADH-ubiquinone oxidoreductase-F iron-sulfur binding region domain-containing protein [Bacillota bacterium]|nr:NADH-ubiquinone oxidoreductase-F iron-sulfur binding region domain-containing protein [Bacillota bacterium]